MQKDSTKLFRSWAQRLSLLSLLVRSPGRERWLSFTVGSFSPGLLKEAIMMGSFEQLSLLNAVNFPCLFLIALGIDQRTLQFGGCGSAACKIIHRLPFFVVTDLAPFFHGLPPFGF